MARPKMPVGIPVGMAVEQVSGNPVGSLEQKVSASLATSAAIYKQGKSNVATDRHQIAQAWQIQAYRHVNICGEARYAVTLFAAMAGRAEIGVSDANSLGRKPVWVTSGTEVDALNELAPSVRDRAKLIRDFMTHWVIGGECYLIARDRLDIDPEYESSRRNTPVWEIVGVTELRKIGMDEWSVRHDNGNYVALKPGDPVIRMWNPDPANRREAWSPFRSLLPTLREIEWLTRHIFTQVRSRLMSAGVWFLPENMTFPPPPPDAVEGGAEALAEMNEAEQFMLSLANISMQQLDDDEVSMPAVVMADPIALANIDQNKLIKFWSNIDDKAMTLRTDAIRRFALGMDLPPDQVLGSSGLTVNEGRAQGATNHWGMWANQEQTISDHIEPALDYFVGVLTVSFLKNAVPKTDKVIAYDSARMRLRQDLSQTAIEWYDRGVLKAEVALRETGFDPENDMMDDKEHRIWLLNQLVKGSPSPEQVQAAFLLLTGKDLPVEPAVGKPVDSGSKPKGLPGVAQPPSLEDHPPQQGKPQGDQYHNPAPYALQLGQGAALAASCEVLVLRALEKAGNRLLNDGKRGREKDRSTPPHMAHLTAEGELAADPSLFDFSLASTVFGDRSAMEQAILLRKLSRFCSDLYENGQPYTRAALMEALR